MSPRRTPIPRAATGRRGLTLIELMVAVVILGVLAAVALPSFRELIARKRIEGIAQELQTDLRYLKAQQIESRKPVRIRFNSNAESTCYILYFTGSNIENCNCSLTNAPMCGDPAIPGMPVEIRTVTVPRSSGITVTANINFLELLGHNALPSNNNTMVASVAGSVGGEVRVSTNPIGLPTLCSVSGPSSSIPACPVN